MLTVRMLYSYECKDKHVHWCGPVAATSTGPRARHHRLTLRGRRLNAEWQLCMRMTSLQLLPDACPRAAPRLPVELHPFAPDIPSSESCTPARSLRSRAPRCATNAALTARSVRLSLLPDVGQPSRAVGAAARGGFPPLQRMPGRRAREERRAVGSCPSLMYN